MMGTATSRTAPHQNCSTSQPPKIGPRAAPPEKPAAQMATASRRRLGSGKMLRISDSVDGISMAPKKPSAARPAISHSALGANAVAAETAAKPDAADQQQPAAADPVAQAAHRDQQSGQDQGIGVHDPQQLRRRRRPGCVAIAGRANVRAVLSTATSRTGNISRARRQPVAPRPLARGRRVRLAGACWPCCGEGLLDVLMTITIPSGRYS